MTQHKLSYIWMAVGLVFGIVGLIGLLSGQFMSLLTLMIAALIIYTSIFQLGGWYVVKQDAKLFWMTHRPSKAKKAVKRRNNFKVIKK